LFLFSVIARDRAGDLHQAWSCMSGRSTEHGKERTGRGAQRAWHASTACAGLATKSGDGYPASKSIHGKEEVWFDSDLSTPAEYRPSGSIIARRSQGF